MARFLQTILVDRQEAFLIFQLDSLTGRGERAKAGQRTFRQVQRKNARAEKAGFGS
jgi:hypothetical protein